MKSLLLAVMGCFVLTGLAQAEGIWLTDYDQAFKKAKAENKAVLMDFTGSDWCPPCIILKKNVFNNPEFIKYAEKNLVLLEVDFPQGFDLPPKQAEANLKLAQRLGIADSRGIDMVPQVFIFNKDGKQLAHLIGIDGSLAFEVKPFLASLAKILK